MKLNFHGIVKNGKLTLDDERGFKNHLSTLGERITLTLDRFHKDRSDNQNRYYWGVIVEMIASEMGERDKMKIHGMLKEKFLREIVSIGDDKKRIELTVTKDTSKLSTKEFEEYTAAIREWASDFFPLFIPQPNEISL